MQKINLLSPLVADMIAAGEVVERPGSVIKELLENAIDAGAKNVTVEFRNGGGTYIRVTDDGCGMSPEDAGVAFERHATSKLKDERGLEAIGTLGFRGEALAAISAVSRVELTTREHGAELGTFVALEAGEIQEMHQTGCPEGTTMIVRDLFYNTPARLKFMKSDRSEAQHCTALALRCAMGHPEVSVRCIRDGKDEFFSPGDGRADSCVYSLLGRETARDMLRAESRAEDVSVTGFVSSPRAGRGNRGMQFFFCNGRPIRSATLQAALEQAYKNTLMVGRFPACVLYITVRHAAVDVNVHPTKNEVKFSNERGVFDGVYHAALSALEREDALPERPREASAPKMAGPGGGVSPAARQTSGGQMRLSQSGVSAAPAAPAPRADFYRQMTAGEFRQHISGGGKAPRETEKPTMSLASPTAAYHSGQRTVPPPVPVRTERAGTPVPRPENAPSAPVPMPERPAPAEELPSSEPEAPAFILVGEALGCYILVELGDSLVLIDKHAAHERLIFDRLKAEKRPVMSQTLLLPVTLSPGAGDAELLLANAEMLERLGFEIEPFGRESVVLRAVPADTDAADAQPMLEELLEKLRSHQGLDADGALDEVLHTVACKAAIKAGRRSEPQELRALAEKVLSGQVKYCPHGRPVSVTVTRRELDKLFGRLG